MTSVRVPFVIVFCSTYVVQLSLSLNPNRCHHPLITQRIWYHFFTSANLKETLSLSFSKLHMYFMDSPLLQRNRPLIVLGPPQVVVILVSWLYHYLNWPIKWAVNLRQYIRFENLVDLSFNHFAHAKKCLNPS